MKNLYNDENQLMAVNHGDGPALICAGPGSGKTYVITNRIHNLVQNRHVPPNKILVITFTKAAAHEMKARYLSLSDLSSTDILFGTFHSVYLNFLKYFSSVDIPQIIDSGKQNKLVKDIIFSSPILCNNLYFSTDRIDEIISAISFYKTTKYTYPSDFPPELFLLFFKQYTDCLNSANLMDYDDILLKCFNLLSVNTNNAALLKNKYDYILVDEFQDINKLQYDILKMIVNDRHNIFIVGDDDQSIYGFRGASPGIMKEFVADYPETVSIRLYNNYRCSSEIVQASDKLISHNLSRIYSGKHLSKNQIHGEFILKEYTSKEEEYEEIRRIYIEENRDNKKCAILVRTNKDVYVIKEYLKKGIIFSEQENIPKALEEEIVSDIKSYIHFCISKDRASLLNIVNKPNRFINRDIFSDEIICLSNLINKYKGSYKGNMLEIFKRNIDILEKSSSFAFITYLYNITGYKNYILDKYPSSKGKILQILEKISNKSKKFHILHDFYNNLTFTRTSLENDDDINIMTFHASKGLEFDTVILPDVNEGKIPGRASLKSGDTEEERRLFYVAMTRAKTKLLISFVKGADSMRMLPSRFITEFL